MSSVATKFKQVLGLDAGDIYDITDITPECRRKIRTGQIGTIVRFYRNVPFMLPFFALVFASLLDSNQPQILIQTWLCLIILIYATMFFVQEQYFSNPEIQAAPDQWLKSYIAICWGTNLVWIGLVPLFWVPSNPMQEALLFLIMISHSITVTAVSYRTLPVYYASSVLPMAMTVAAALYSGGSTHFVLAIVTLGLFAFLFSVAHAAYKQNLHTFFVKFRNEELLENLAREKAELSISRNETAKASLDLAEREELFRAVVENAFDIILLTDDKGRIHYASPSLSRLGIPPAQANGQTVTALLGMAETTGESPSPGRSSERIITRNGTHSWIETAVTDLRRKTSAGGFVFNIRDVTERKRADDEMNAHLEVLDALAKGAPLEAILTQVAASVDHTSPGAHAAVILTNRDNQIVKAIGASMPQDFLEQINGTELTEDSCCCGAALAQRHRVIVSDVMSDPLESGCASLLNAANFRSRWAQPILSRSGELFGVLTTFYRECRVPSDFEIAFASGAAHLAGIAIERRLQERQLREATETAVMANRTKSQFLATMSHELRTPLNAIIGFSEVIKKEIFGSIQNERYSGYISDILTSGQHLLSMIDDILDLSKIEAGRYELELGHVDPVELVYWCAELVKPKLNEGNLTLKFEVPDSLPDIYADRRALRQILLNLMSNAIKFTHPGGQVTACAGLSDTGELTIAVQDTGIGIPKDRINNTLEPFVQIPNRFTGKHHGTGLGLSITKTLVEMHEGTFRIESEEGVGTQVSFTLPTTRLIPRKTDAA